MPPRGAMPSPWVEALRRWLAGGRRVIGQIAIEERFGGGFILRHRDDWNRNELEDFSGAECALSIAKFDSEGKFRPLKTAPNLRHGWRLALADILALRAALDFFYPGRLAILLAFERQELRTTSLRKALDRQSGMYRVAAKISDDQIDDLIGKFCQSQGGCLRTILWARDESGAVASTKLPERKFDPTCDQATTESSPSIPLLCQEACNLLIAEARKIVKAVDKSFPS